MNNSLKFNDSAVLRPATISGYKFTGAPNGQYLCFDALGNRNIELRIHRNEIEELLPELSSVPLNLLNDPLFFIKGELKVYGQQPQEIEVTISASTIILGADKLKGVDDYAYLPKVS